MIAYDVKIKHLEEVLAGLSGERWDAARIEALGDATTAAKGRVYDWIENAGDGTWPKFHPLTKMYSKKGGEWQRRGRFLSASNFNWLTQFVNDWVARSGYRSGVSFGRPKRGFRLFFLAGRAKAIERGEKTTVTPTMRRMMGATRLEGGEQIPGRTFFPLRKDTHELTLPRRAIMEPVAKKYLGDIVRSFEKSYVKETKL